MRVNIAISGQETKDTAGLHGFMQKIYSHMTLALLITGVIAYLVPQSEILLNALYVTQDGKVIALEPLAWLIMMFPLGISLYLGHSLPVIQPHAAELGLWLYAFFMGISLSVIFIIFSGQVIAGAFLTSAAAYAGLSLYGYLTRRDLSGMGAFMFMGLIGLIIASLMNMLLHSSGAQFAISVVGVLIFAGLTAYDTQRLKSLYAQYSGNAEWIGKIAVLGALSLYLDFINIFLSLVNLAGGKRK